MEPANRRVTLAAVTLPAVEYIACRMRAADEREIYGLLPHNNPFLLARYIVDLVNAGGFGVVACLGERPVAALGFIERHPRCLSAWAFATDEFPRVAKTLTKFVLTELRPALIASPAHRLEADSRFDHLQAHAWLKVLGFREEGILHRFGKDGADYIRFYQLKESDNVHCPENADATGPAAAA